MKYCTQCGAALPDDARFCSRCGVAQIAVEAAPLQSAPASSMIAAAPPQNAPIPDVAAGAPAPQQKAPAPGRMAATPDVLDELVGKIRVGSVLWIVAGGVAWLSVLLKAMACVIYALAIDTPVSILQAVMMPIYAIIAIVCMSFGMSLLRFCKELVAKPIWILDTYERAGAFTKKIIFAAGVILASTLLLDIISVAVGAIMLAATIAELAGPRRYVMENRREFEKLEKVARKQNKM